MVDVPWIRLGYAVVGTDEQCGLDLDVAIVSFRHSRSGVPCTAMAPGATPVGRASAAAHEHQRHLPELCQLVGSAPHGRSAAVWRAETLRRCELQPRSGNGGDGTRSGYGHDCSAVTRGVRVADSRFLGLLRAHRREPHGILRAVHDYRLDSDDSLCRAHCRYGLRVITSLEAVHAHTLYNHRP